MPVTVVVGGQYGSEGKGKLVSHLACASASPPVVVRCGGSNAGHTAQGHGRRALLRQLPSGVVDPRSRLFLAAGMQLDVSVLLAEIEELNVQPGQLLVDPNAVVIEEGDVALERQAGLLERLGSTLTGTGGAAARKVLRTPDVVRAADVQALQPYIGDVAHELNRAVDSGCNVIVEGTQGFGLSLHHGPFPFVTGRDTTAAAFLSEAGLSPLVTTEVAVVLRTYPIRVAGNSGPLGRETGWDEVARRSGCPTALAEYTTVTGRLRRVSEFDWHLAQRAVTVNRPTAIAVHGLDYLDYDDLGVREWAELSARSRAFVDELEQRLCVPVRWLYTGPDGADLIDRGAGIGTHAVHAPSSTVAT